MVQSTDRGGGNAAPPVRRAGYFERACDVYVHVTACRASAAQQVPVHSGATSTISQTKGEVNL